RQLRARLPSTWNGYRLSIKQKPRPSSIRKRFSCSTRRAKSPTPPHTETPPPCSPRRCGRRTPFAAAHQGPPERVAARRRLGFGPAAEDLLARQGQELLDRFDERGQCWLRLVFRQ